MYRFCGRFRDLHIIDRNGKRIYSTGISKVNQNSQYTQTGRQHMFFKIYVCIMDKITNLLIIDGLQSEEGCIQHKLSL